MKLKSQKEADARAAAVERPKEQTFRMVMGPLMCIVFGFAAAYISYLIVPGEDRTPWGWRMYVCAPQDFWSGPCCSENDCRW